MGIGDYKYRVTFRGYTSVPDGYGGQTDTPVDLLTTWARKRSIRSSRNLSEAQVNLKNAALFDIRWRKDFEPKVDQLVIVDGKDYVINGVVERNDDHRFYEITAVDQTNA